MGNKRTFTAWLIVLSLALVPNVSYAQDVGPGREVRAIRHDLPIILSSRVAPSELTIDNVAVSENSALAQIRGLDGTDVVVMTRQLDTWWYDYAIRLTPQGNAWTCEHGRDADPSGVTPALLLRLGVRPSLVELATTAIPAVGEAQRRARETQTQYPARPSCDLFALPMELTTRSTEGYDLTTRLNVHDVPANAQFSYVRARAPTRAESWITPDNNAYFFFSALLDSTATIHVESGTTLDVWFPFVLRSSKTYNLTIAHTDPVILNLKGTLKDNTLHFVLPAFAVAPGAELMGEIDGEPYDN